MVAFPHDAVVVDSSIAIPPFIVRTGNVAKELMQAAINHKVSVHSLDFRILEVQTLSLMIAENQSDADEWAELSDTDISAITDDLYLNPKFELKQLYEVEIFSITEAGKLDHVGLSIAANATLCKIYLTIKQGSELIYDETFEEDFFELIKKKKLRANLMIGIFDSMMHTNLSEFIAKIKVNGTYRVDEQERFVVAQGLEPIATIDDQLILHYDKKKNSAEETDHVDYSKRGYIISAVANDLLIEYIKPKKGTNGRNCRGEYIAAKEPLIRYEPTFTIGENIVREENEVGM